MTYFGFEAQRFVSDEAVGTLLVNVSRLGLLDGTCTVFFRTLDMTAEAGKDYVGRQVRNHMSTPHPPCIEHDMSECNNILLI